MTTTALHALVGWSNGYLYSQYKKTEDEIRQGGNHVLAALPQAAQWTTLSNMVITIAQTLSSPLLGTFKILGNIIPIISLPLSVGLGIIKDDKTYTKFAKTFNGWSFSWLQLPTKLNSSSVAVKIAGFVSENLGNFLRIALIASSIALIAIGAYACGIAALSALAYEVIDSRGWIPFKVSLFIETYMPIVTLCGLLVSGTLVGQVIAVLTLLSYSRPINTFIQHQVDHLIRFIFGMDGSSLKEIESPLKTHYDLTYDAMNKILDAWDGDFEISPAHLSKMTFDTDALPEDRSFDTFLTLFDRVNWEEKYGLVLRKLKDDDRFVQFLKTKFSNIEEPISNDQCDKYISELASKEGVTKEAYLAQHLREQQQGLIDGLMGRIPVAGSKQDLYDAQNNYAKVLPYLLSLNEKTERYDFEDTLLALAVEGGRYCARGLKRSSSELTRKILSRSLPKKESYTGSPREDYELRLKQRLQDMRSELVEKVFQALCKSMQLPDVIANDVHGLDIYRIYLALGFTPLTPYERDNLSLSTLGVWEFYQKIRKEMIQEYKRALTSAFTDIGLVDFAPPMSTMINENPNLSPLQKEHLIEQLTAGTVEAQFQRLMLVMMGILRFTPT